MRSKAEAILATVNEERIWQRLLRSRNARVVLDTMKYLTDRRDGKAAQAVDLSMDVSAEIAERLKALRKRGAECLARERAAQASEKGTVTDCSAANRLP